MAHASRGHFPRGNSYRLSLGGQAPTARRLISPGAPAARHGAARSLLAPVGGRGRRPGGRLTLSGPGEVLAVVLTRSAWVRNGTPPRSGPAAASRGHTGDCPVEKEGMRGGPWLVGGVGPSALPAGHPAPSRPPPPHGGSNAAGPAAATDGGPAEAPFGGLRSWLARRLRAGCDGATLHATGGDPEWTWAAAAAMQAWRPRHLEGIVQVQGHICLAYCDKVVKKRRTKTSSRRSARRPPPASSRRPST